MDRKHLEECIDAWTKGTKIDMFNTEAAGTEPRHVNMSPSNDGTPGVLGYNR